MKQLKLLTRRADSRNGSPDARWQAPVTPSKGGVAPNVERLQIITTWVCLRGDWLLEPIFGRCGQDERSVFALDGPFVGRKQLTSIRGIPIIPFLRC